jgi:hypothetical protein
MKARGPVAQIGQRKVYMTPTGPRYRVKTAMGWRWEKTGRPKGKPKNAEVEQRLHQLQEKFRQRGIAVSMDKLRANYEEAQKPYERKLTRRLVIIKQGKNIGAKRVRYVERPRQIVLRPSAIRRAQITMGGWEATGQPTVTHFNVMKKLGVAKVVKGAPRPRHKWSAKEDALIVPWKPESTAITAHLWQFKQGPERKKATAIVSMKIGYPYARQFIENWITGPKRRSDYLGQLERSAGYQNFLRGQGA